MQDRRQLLERALSLTALGLAPGSLARARALPRAPLFRISLAQWSLHRALQAGELDNLDFAASARSLGIDAVEYVNQFFADRAGDFEYLGTLRQRAQDQGVQSVLIMIDGEGQLADADDAARRRAIERHFKWLAAARFLGCHAIRVNAGGSGSWDEQRARAADSLHRLGELANDYDLSVIVENHGGLSSNGKWLAEVMRAADHPRVGTLPDFGNFDLGAGERYDRYQGVAELMPFARAVSAKSHAFDERGEETATDYHRMLAIVVEAGYRGHVGIEYEGSAHPELEGVRLTKTLLERVRAELVAGD